MMRESDKHFLFAMYSATAIILFWKGVWEGVGSLPFLENPWFSLFVGAVMLTISGTILREFDPLGGLEKGALKILNYVNNHPQKHQFTVKYLDKKFGKNRTIRGKTIKHIEKNIISIHEGNKEIFVPIHRVMSVHQNGKMIWKL